jgi:hypothetical protein
MVPWFATNSKQSMQRMTTQRSTPSRARERGARSATRLRLLVLIGAVLLACAAAMPAVSNAAGHSYRHGIRQCDVTKMWVYGNYMYASVDAGERVRVTETLWRWTGTKWIKGADGPTIYARPAGVNTMVFGHLSNWYDSSGVQDGDGTAHSFALPWRGYYYAIAEEIVWLNSAGAQVDRTYDWLYSISGGSNYYCYS